MSSSSVSESVERANFAPPNPLRTQRLYHLDFALRFSNGNTYLSLQKDKVKTIINERITERIAIGQNSWGIYMPHGSDELLQFWQQSSDAIDASYLVIDEASFGDTIQNVPYNLLDNFQVQNHPVDEALRRTDANHICFGHIDFCGNILSPKRTRTDEVIELLSNKLGERSCFAFTHSTTVRRADNIIEKACSLTTDFAIRTRSVEEIGMICDYRSSFVNSLTRKSKKATQALPTGLLIAIMFAQSTGFSCHIEVTDQLFYIGHGGRQWMTTDIVYIDKSRPFNINATLDSLMENLKEIK